MLLTVEERVSKLEVSIKDINESLNGAEDRIDNWKEQSRDYVKMSFDSTMDKVNELFISHKDKLSERNDALEAMELEVELALCQAALGEGVSSAALTNKDVLKPKEFVGTKSTCGVNNFLWRMKNYFHDKGITDDAVKEEVRAKLQGITQRGTVGEYVREFNELMLRVLELEAMMVAASMVKLGLGKDKLRSSKSEERGVCEKDHKEDNVGNGIDDSGGVSKPRFRKCPKKSIIEGDGGANKEPKKLSSSKNCPKQVVVKGKATSELRESLKGLPPKEEVSLSSILREKVATKIVKLGPMRLNSSEASELAESSTRLPPMGEVGGPSDFKQKEVMQVGQLTRVNVTNRMVQVKKQRKPWKKF
ncbi:hypothetical protein Goshw_017053 [Gossypium schwendimanii]|uniref:Retrotransposon gag domain-containing protein n=1 Tax=Gossypium schwendimanii TaxID=34291 RepID=A0A7J9L3N0_GOSSC|nr:hypothetical protein [Gossypium schwendimanii]